MKKMIALISTLALCSLPTIVKADKNDAMIEMVMKMVKQSGQAGILSSCLNITEQKVLEAYKETVVACIPKDGLEGECMENLAPTYFGVSKEKLMACDPDDEEVENEEDIDFSTLSEAEVTELLQKRQAEALASVKEMTDLLERNSEGTLHKISLPVYEPSALRAHYVNGMQNSKGKTTLPAATLSTDDNIKKVIQFYKDSLPSYKIDHSNDVYTIMQEIPDDLFKLSMDTENLPLYFTPNIQVYSLNFSGHEITQIVITYNPK